MQKRSSSLNILLLFAILIMANSSYAAKRYWTGRGTNKNWNNTANWSATSNGTSSASVPGTSDSAYFDGAATHKQCSMEVAGSVKMLTISGDTLKQNANVITIGTSGGVFSGGTFLGGSSTITDNGIFTLSGTNFTCTSGLLNVVGNYTFSSGRFIHNNGELKLSGGTQSVTGSDTLYHLTLAATTLNIASGTILIVNNLLDLNNSTINTGNIYVKGNIQQNGSNTTGGGSATITINGSGSQTFFGQTSYVRRQHGWAPNIVIKKSSSDTLFLKNWITIKGNWTDSSGIINIKKYSSTLCFPVAGTNTIYGKQSVDSILIVGSGGSTNTVAINTGDTLTVKGSIITDGASESRFTGIINLKGDIIINNTNNVSTATGGTGTIIISDSLNQTITGASSIGKGRLCNIKIDKPGGKLILKNIINVGGDWKYLRGRIDAGTNSSTVCFAYSTGRTISGKDTLYNVSFYAPSTCSNTISSGDTLIVNGELKFEGTNFITVNTGVINARANITVTNTVNAGSAGSGIIHICGTGNQTFTGSGISGAGNLCSVTVDKPGTSDTLKLASTISFSTSATWKYVQGVVNPGSSTCTFGGGATINGGTTSSSMCFNNFRVQGGTTAVLAGVLNVKGIFYIDAARTLNAVSYPINIGGNWDNDNGTFIYGTSTVTFNGSSDQYTVYPNTAQQFYNVVINKPSGKLHLLGQGIFINDSLTLIKGVIAASSTKFVSLPDNAIFTGGSDLSYVCGPIKKTGNDAFTFALGDTVLTSGAYHPLSINAPSNAADAFIAQYYAANQTSGSTKVDSIDISTCEYWTIARTVGSSNVKTTLGWNSNNCLSSNNYDMVVAGWDGSASKWKSLESTAITSSGYTGTVAASLTPFWSGTSAVPILIAKKKAIAISELVVEPYCVAGHATGSIDVSVAYGAPPFSYTWSNSAHTQDLSSLTANTYSLTITDRRARTFTKSYTLENCVDWQTLPSTLTSDSCGKIKKISGDTSWVNGIAQSTKIFDSIQNGEWIKFVIGDTISNYYIGFGSVAADSLANEANLMFSVEGRNVTVIQTDNDGFYSKVVIGTVVTGDILEVELDDAGINYYKNGKIVYTGTLLSNVRMQFTTNVYGQNNIIKNIRCSNN